MDKIDVPNNKVAESDDDIKIVTIGGKQLELKYEFPRKRVDIFGLHTNNKRNGIESKRPSKSDSSTNRRSDENRIIGHKKNSFSKKQKTFVETNNNSNYSLDSNESSIIESVKSLSKVDKLMRRLQSNESVHKKNSSVEQVVNKLKKDKEPVKIANRFDKLLSSNILDDYNLSDKNSAKKSKKKKNKSSLNCFDNNSDENRNKNVTQNQLIDQNVSENIRTDSVPQTESSFEENPNNNKLFQTNNNLNNRYSTKSDKNFVKLNNEEEKHTKQEILRIYKNPIHETYNLSQRKSIEENVGLSDNSVDQTLNQINESSSSEESEKESKKETKLNDEMAANAQQNNLWSTSNRYPNGRLTLRPMTPKDKTENKPLLEQQLIKVIKEESVYRNLSFMNCLLIIGGIVAFLSIYTFTILRQFCNCN